jgi:hypothetical protein
MSDASFVSRYDQDEVNMIRTALRQAQTKGDHYRVALYSKSGQIYNGSVSELSASYVKLRDGRLEFVTIALPEIEAVRGDA